MQLSLTSWSMPACSLEEVAGISKVLGINAIDVGLFYKSALDRDEILADPMAVAEKVKALQVRIPNYYHLFGDGLGGRNLALPDHIDENCRDFERALTFCEAAGIGTVFVLPGIVNPGQSRERALAQSATSLTALMAVASHSPVTLTIEPHVHSYLESPSLVLRLLDQVEGLKLTLDYAHFVCLGYRQEEIDPLAPHAAHVHLRQARPGVLQAKAAEGTINMAAQFGTLRDAGFTGSMALEYVHQNYMATLYEDVLTETVALRDLYRIWSATSGDSK